MSKKAVTTDELIRRAVVRKHVDSEWMSKMSSKEFREWEFNERMTYLICKYPEHEHDAKLQQQIEFKENEYKLRKEQVLEHKKKSNAVDKSLNDHIDEINTVISKDNGLPKHQGRDICLGGDLVGVPGVKNAKLDKKHIPIGYRKVAREYEQLTATTTQYGTVNKNGRFYEPKVFDLKDNYDGKLEHPDVWYNKFEKLVKKYGIQ